MVLHKQVYSLYAMKVLSSSAAGKTFSLYHGKTTFHFFCNSRPVPCLWWAVQRDSIFFEIWNKYHKNICHFHYWQNWETTSSGTSASPCLSLATSKVPVFKDSCHFQSLCFYCTYLLQQFDKDTHQLQMLSFRSKMWRSKWNSRFRIKNDFFLKILK